MIMLNGRSYDPSHITIPKTDIIDKVHFKVKLSIIEFDL